MSDVIFTWSNEGGEPTGYRFSLGTTAAANELVDGNDVGDVTSFSFDGVLDYNTTYYWKVVAYNASGDASNTQVWEFTSMQNPLVNSFPWLADFNDYVLHNTSAGSFRYPLGWSLENNNSLYYCWDKISNNANNPNNAYSDSVAMHIINFSFTDPLDDWLFTNPLYLEAGNQYELSFMYKTSAFPGEETIEKMEVKWGTDNTSTAMFADPLFYDDNITAREYTEFTTIVSPETTGEFYFGFRAFSEPMQWILYLDDVQVSLIEGGTATFIVNGDGSPLQGADISIDGQVITTNASGEAQIMLANGTFDYTITATGFGTVNGSVTVDNNDVTEFVDMTDIDDLASIGMRLYPNPVEDQLHIEGQGEFTVSLINPIGQIVLNKTINNSTNIDMSDYASGIYFVNIKSQGTIITERIVVK
jgi:hypothetical protein